MLFVCENINVSSLSNKSHTGLKKMANNEDAILFEDTWFDE